MMYMTMLIVLTFFFSLSAMDNIKREPDQDMYTSIEGKPTIIQLFSDNEKVADETGEAKQKYYAGYTQEALVRHGKFRSLPIFIKKDATTQISEYEKKRMASKLYQDNNTDCGEFIFAGEVATLFNKEAFNSIFERNYIVSKQNIPVVDAQSDAGYIWRKIIIANTKKTEDGNALCRQLKRDFICSIIKSSVDKLHPFNKMRVCIPCEKSHFMEVGKLAALSKVTEYRTVFAFDKYTLCDCHQQVQEDIIVAGIDQNEPTCRHVAAVIREKLEPPHRDLLEKDWILLCEEKS